MPWVKLDDGFFDNDKIVAAGKDARDLYLAGLCYCARSLTDGYIPNERTARLAVEAGIVDGRAAVERLCTVIRGQEYPLWEKTDGGYLVHDYLEYNPTKEEVIEMREKRSEAGKMGGQRSGEVRRSKRSKNEANDEANAEAKTKQNGSKIEPHAHARTQVPGPMPRPKDKPASAGASEDATERKTHQAFFAVISREWGTPANDLERGRYNVACKNFRQAHVAPDEVPILKAAYRARWPGMECTPLAVASSIRRLQEPPSGRADDIGKMVSDTLDKMARGESNFG